MSNEFFQPQFPTLVFTDVFPIDLNAGMYFLFLLKHSQLSHLCVWSSCRPAPIMKLIFKSLRSLLFWHVDPASRLIRPTHHLYMSTSKVQCYPLNCIMQYSRHSCFYGHFFSLIRHLYVLFSIVLGMRINEWSLGSILRQCESTVYKQLKMAQSICLLLHCVAQLNNRSPLTCSISQTAQDTMQNYRWQSSWCVRPSTYRVTYKEVQLKN